MNPGHILKHLIMMGIVPIRNNTWMANLKMMRLFMIRSKNKLYYSIMNNQMDPGFRKCLFNICYYISNLFTYIEQSFSWFGRSSGISEPVRLEWWRHQMETFSALLAICVGNSPVPGEYPAQRPVTRSFDVFFDLHLNKRFSRHPWGWWFEMP